LRGGHEFNQVPTHHLRGKGCAKCAGIGQSTTAEFIAKAKRIHGDRYDYSKVVYEKSKIHVIIICRVHGENRQTPSHHLDGAGCPACAGVVKSTTEEFIRKARVVHGNRYDYSLVDYITARAVVDIICIEHQLTFSQTPNNHLCNHGCAKCAGNTKSNTEEFIQKARAVHGDRYNYSYVEYVSCKIKVDIICQVKGHGVFTQVPSDHLSGNNCFRCVSKGYSKMQVQWLELIEKCEGIHIQHMGNSTQEHTIRSTNWKADGYCEATNTIYEFHGSYWHGDPTMYEADYVHPLSRRTMGDLYAGTIARDAAIEELGYNLVVIWESKWKKMNRSVRLLQRKFRSGSA